MALEVAKSLVSGHPDSALANALTALTLMKISLRDSNVVRRREYIASALDFSKTALALSPKSIAFGFLNAKIHLANAHDDAAIQECESAMSIEDPRDPWLDYLGIINEGYDSDPQESSKESRIERVRTELRKLLVKAKRYKFKRLVEDHSLAEINKEFQALQDRKEEIQTRFDRERQSFEKMEMKSPSTSTRKLKKVLSNVDMITRARDYWNNGMSLEAKKDFLSVRIEKFFHKNKSMGVKAKEVLAEAVEYAKEMKSWKFSTCCCCGQRFSDEELNLEHIKSAHLGTFSEELQSVVPKIVPASEIEIGDWRPVNVVAAAKLIEDLSRNDSGNKGQDEGKSQDLKLKNLPHCNDINRGMLIKSIWILLQLFIEIECFAPSHFYMLLDLILEMLKNQIPETLLNQSWMKTTLVSVWFLDEPELESVQEFLIEELGISCGLQGLYTSFHRDKARRDLTITHESIVFRDDALSHLIPLLDETSELASRSVDDIKNVGQEYRDNIVQWLFTGGEPIGEKLKEWEKYREASKSLGTELFKIIESEFHRLQNMCERKCKYLRHEKLWLDMEGICLEEDKRRKEISGNPQSYRSLLLKRQKDIEKEKSIEEMGSMELDIIESVLKKAQADNDIKMLFQMHIHQMGGKCFKSDATILATNAAMQQTWNKLKMVTSYDYRSIVVPLLKTFMRAQLEDMVDKYATEKSNAEIEVLLSELDLNAKNNTGREGVDARQGQGKSKNKKKKEDHRKVKEFKATGGSEDQQGNVEQTSVPAAHGKDHALNPEIVGPVTTDELEQEERELTRKAEEECRVEEHRRMLARHLEYQRQIENEAKQKRLAEIDKA
ncbi:uncharacterized protein LOC142634730 [Castanea sativa]|uniref:uncharacterized protein LOC142634730 n=1 Tax=Castanea sativa TaxID=21020 RepID=UPI003F64D096